MALQCYCGRRSGQAKVKSVAHHLQPQDLVHLSSNHLGSNGKQNPSAPLQFRSWRWPRAGGRRCGAEQLVPMDPEESPLRAHQAGARHRRQQARSGSLSIRVDAGGTSVLVLTYLQGLAPSHPLRPGAAGFPPCAVAALLLLQGITGSASQPCGPGAWRVASGLRRSPFPPSRPRPCNHGTTCFWNTNGAPGLKRVGHVSTTGPVPYRKESASAAPYCYKGHTQAEVPLMPSTGGGGHIAFWTPSLDSGPIPPGPIP